MSTDKRARQKANRANRIAEAEAQAAQDRRRARLFTYGGLGLAVFAIIIAVAVLLNDDDDTTDAAGEGDVALDEAYGDDQSSEGSVTVAPDPTTPTTIIPDPVPLENLTPCPPAEGVDTPQIDFGGPMDDCLTDGATYVAVFDTSMGEMRFTLDTDSTPLTTNNFVALARYGYYDGTEFFRTDTSIDIIQGGAPHTNSPSDQGPGYNLTDEPQFAFDGFALQGTYTYEPGQLVMARTGTPNGASAQFFFAAGPNTSRLDATGDFDGSGTYVVFGQTDAAGQQVMADILALHVDDPSSGLGGAPSETVVVNSVTIEES